MGGELDLDAADDRVSRVYLTSFCEMGEMSAITEMPLFLLMRTVVQHWNRVRLLWVRRWECDRRQQLLAWYIARRLYFIVWGVAAAGSAGWGVMSERVANTAVINLYIVRIVYIFILHIKCCEGKTRHHAVFCQNWCILNHAMLLLRMGRGARQDHATRAKMLGVDGAMTFCTTRRASDGIVDRKTRAASQSQRLHGGLIRDEKINTHCNRPSTRDTRPWSSHRLRHAIECDPRRVVFKFVRRPAAVLNSLHILGFGEMFAASAVVSGGSERTGWGRL